MATKPKGRNMASLVHEQIEIGNRVSWWLRLAYRTSAAKRVAREFNVSERQAKRWIAGERPTSEHLGRMARAFGWRASFISYSRDKSAFRRPTKSMTGSIKLPMSLPRCAMTFGGGKMADEHHSPGAGLAAGAARTGLYLACPEDRAEALTPPPGPHAVEVPVGGKVS
jgi:hypothetical protein